MDNTPLKAPGRISVVSVLVCAGIVLMAVVRQYLSGQY
jgi:hypothetical protein